MSKISSEINTIFLDNEKSDLKRFIDQRQRMNVYHIRMRYLFHTVQCTSMFITTFAVGYGSETTCPGANYHNIIWLGIGLNMLATLIQAFEHVNQSVSKKMMNDIRMIKSGKYIDETDYADSKRNVVTNNSSIESV